MFDRRRVGGPRERVEQHAAAVRRRSRADRSRSRPFACIDQCDRCVLRGAVRARASRRARARRPRADDGEIVVRRGRREAVVILIRETEVTVGGSRSCARAHQRFNFVRRDGHAARDQLRSRARARSRRPRCGCRCSSTRAARRRRRARTGRKPIVSVMPAFSVRHGSAPLPSRSARAARGSRRNRARPCRSSGRCDACKACVGALGDHVVDVRSAISG